jgi:N-dimethylarginine dimethylaminohydrolase
MTKLLMCPPTHFGVTYDINPWMSHNVGAPTPSAHRQWERLVALLLGAGARIELMEPHPGVPDLVFTANAALICDKSAIVSSFRFEQRQAEEPFYGDRLASLGFETSVVQGSYFEGAGDALYDRRLPILYFGHGWRSDRAAMAQIDAHCGVRVLPLRLLEPRFYHLDTCLCPLASGHVLAFMDAFSHRSQALLRMTLGDFLIEISEDDALAFACNAVEVNDSIVMHRASAALSHRLDTIGYSVHETDLSEFQKAGGSAKCLTLKLNDGPIRRAASASFITGTKPA